MLTLIILSSLSPPAPTQILPPLMLRTSVRKNCRELKENVGTLLLRL